MLGDKREIQDAMHSLNKARISDWADIDHLRAQLIAPQRPTPAAGERNDRERFARGLAFITSDSAIAGVSIEISK